MTREEKRLLARAYRDIKFWCAGTGYDEPHWRGEGFDLLRKLLSRPSLEAYFDDDYHFDGLPARRFCKKLDCFGGY